MLALDRPEQPVTPGQPPERRHSQRGRHARSCGQLTCLDALAAVLHEDGSGRARCLGALARKVLTRKVVHRKDLHRKDLHRKDLHRKDLHRKVLHRKVLHRKVLPRKVLGAPAACP
jgi:hypothetical protein